MRSAAAALLVGAIGCSDGRAAAPRTRAAETSPAPRPSAEPGPRTPAPARGERALWAIQDTLARAATPLREVPRLRPEGRRADVAPIAVRLDDGLAWTASIERCTPPAESDCLGRWEDGVCECAVLALVRGEERASLVVSESAALGRPTLRAIEGPEGRGALWLSADLYDRVEPWPRVGFLIEGDPVPRLAARIVLGQCRFRVDGDPEEERAPAACDPVEGDVRYEGPVGQSAVRIDVPGRTLRWRRSEDGSLEPP